MPSGRDLASIAAEVGGTLVGAGSGVVTDVTHDSRQAGPGCLFVAVVGFTADGHDFAADAAANGAAAVVVSRPVAVDVPQILVSDTRRALAPLAAAVHGRPSERLRVVGVTGTNGKTSVTFFVEALAAHVGWRTGLVGTVQTRIGRDVIPTLPAGSARTTPEASDLQRLFHSMVDRDVDVVSVEVSSHALTLGRVDETRFEVAAFTNLTQDHLDFHGDMETYFAAKASLFTPERARRAVICVDDPYGRRLVASTALPVLTVGTAGDADLRAEIGASRIDGTDIVVVFPDGARRSVRLPLPGRFTVANALVAAGCGLSLGMDPDAVVGGLGALPPVPGRFEVVSGDDPVPVVVDYAHTPAGVAAAVATVRDLVAGRVVVVFGAGGERDRTKRPAMGEAASAADVLVVTSDNPRSEDPGSIIAEILTGVPPGTDVTRIPDRAEAIAAAISLARPGDAVLVLGKGHERGQEVGGRVIPFDDRLVVRAELRRLRGSA